MWHTSETCLPINKKKIRVASLSNGNTSNYDSLLCRKEVVCLSEIQAPSLKNFLKKDIKIRNMSCDRTHVQKPPLAQQVRMETWPLFLQQCMQSWVSHLDGRAWSPGHLPASLPSDPTIPLGQGWALMVTQESSGPCRGLAYSLNFLDQASTTADEKLVPQ